METLTNKLNLLNSHKEYLRNHYIRITMEILDTKAQISMNRIIDMINQGKEFVVKHRNKEYEIYTIKGVYRYNEFHEPSDFNLTNIEIQRPKLVVEVFKNGNITEMIVDNTEIIEKVDLPENVSYEF